MQTNVYVLGATSDLSTLFTLNYTPQQFTDQVHADIVMSASEIDPMMVVTLWGSSTLLLDVETKSNSKRIYAQLVSLKQSRPGLDCTLSITGKELLLLRQVIHYASNWIDDVLAPQPVQDFLTVANVQFRPA